MPFDSRWVIFSHDESLAAIRQFYGRAKKRFPAGTVENISAVGEPECQFRCDVVRNNFREHVVVAGTVLGAALIAYCMSRQIPLPRKAEKKLEVRQGKLALAVQMTVNNPEFSPNTSVVHTASSEPLSAE